MHRSNRSKRAILVVAVVAAAAFIAFGGELWPKANASVSTVDAFSKRGVSEVDWKKIHYPIDCGKGVSLSVLEVKSLSPAAGLTRVAVLVQCQLMDGTGNAELMTYRIVGDRAVLTQRLIRPHDGLYPRLANVREHRFFVVDSRDEFLLHVFAYSSAKRPRSSPDVKIGLRWRWNTDRFELLTKIPHHESD